MDIDNLLSILNKEIVINNKPLKELKNYLKDLEIVNYQKYITFSDYTYKRNIVSSNEHLEIIIMCWDTKQGSKFHKHPSNGCLMKIIEGQLMEEFKGKEINQTNIYEINDCSYIDNDLGIHRVFNDSNSPAISLHIYSPPNYYK